MTGPGQPTIVCGVDGSAHADAAIRVAAELAQARQGRLAIVAVNPLSPASGYSDIRGWKAEEQDAILHAATQEARRLGAPAQGVAVEGRNIADTLIDSARRLGADHLVVGTGDRKGLGEWLLGSVAREVAARAPFSVTIAR